MKKPINRAAKSVKKPTKKRAKWRVLIGPTIFTLIGLIFLCELGFWQLSRLAWKEDLIARVTAQTVLPPVPVPPEADWPKVGVAQEYLHVTVSGKFDNGREALAYALLSEPKGKFSGPGYWVMTPLVTASGATIIINRGFVPLAHMDAASRAAGRIEGETTVTGLLRLPEKRNWFTPADDIKKAIFQERAPAVLAKAYGLARVAPFFIDADATPNIGGLPQGGETRLVFPNDHLQYAITWFGLALALMLVFLVFAGRELRRP
jgi:surfeit locus 1 family protein